MTWVRKRRFRKRVHNRSIDTVEMEVETLLNDDKRADRVEYEFIDPALADQMEQDIAQQKLHAHAERTASDEEHKPEDESRAHAEGEEEEDDDDDDLNVDQDLAAELDAALAREQGAEQNDSASDAGAESTGDSDLEDLWDDDDEDQADGEEDVPKSDKEDDDDDDDGEEEAERRVRESQLEAECREIETLIKRKQHDTESTMNTLIKSRHQQALRKLQVEHESKKRLLGDLKHIRRTRREERAAHARSQQDAHAEASTDPSPTEAS